MIRDPLWKQTERDRQNKADQSAARMAAWQAREANKRAEEEAARAQEMHNLEVARLAREAEIKRQQGIVGAEWAVEFLGEWNKDRESLTGMVNTAFADVDKAWESVESGKQWLTDLESHKSLVGQEYESFKEAYAPLEKESMQTQMEALGTQRGLMGQIRDLSTADYEGVSGRAKADVGSEAEKARRAEERRLQGLGMSPESGKSRSAMNRSYVDEALSKVLAANKARALEKDRVAGMATTGLSVINPAQMGGISSGIRSQGLDYLKEMTNIGQAGLSGAINLSQAGGSLAGIRGDLADVYGRNIVAPMGEAGMSLLGTSMAAGPENLSGRVGEIFGGAPSGDTVDTSGTVNTGGIVSPTDPSGGRGFVGPTDPAAYKSGIVTSGGGGDVTGQPVRSSAYAGGMTQRTATPEKYVGSSAVGRAG